MTNTESAIIKAMEKYGNFYCQDSLEVYLEFYNQIEDTVASKYIQESLAEYKTSGVFCSLDIKEDVHKKYGQKILRVLRKLAAKGQVEGFWIGCREFGVMDGLPTRFRAFRLKNTNL